MATSFKVQLSRENVGVFHTSRISDEALVKASELLQENHEKHHIFFNADGFHNHIVHHLLTLVALGASPSIIEEQYDRNKSYQRPVTLNQEKPPERQIVHDMHDEAKFDAHLAQDAHYYDYLVFFQQEIEAKGWEAVLNDYVFKGDQRADDMLARMLDGLLHPIIHLGFGVEFKQPAIIAEALAQAAMHTTKYAPYLVSTEKAAAAETSSTRTSIVSMLDEIRSNDKVATAAHWSDPNKLMGGVWARAADDMQAIAQKFKVTPSELEVRTAEAINAAAYFAGAAQHPPKEIKYDFFHIHSTNSSIFLSVFLQQPWLSTINKVRLLEWKVRVDLLVYASRRAAKPFLDDIVNYRPKQQAKSSSKENEGGPWDRIIERVNALDDDGHAAKLVRALLHGQVVSRPYDDRDEFIIKDAMWLQLGHMAIDSVEGQQQHWVRSAGFEEAWENIGERPRAQL
ncbi:MAG: hypothetical protein M4579_003056 [Chaenotheca gracillima]|nr:MAG: hypothetical protein M4579_003056 [Chaenotheca gracillima]